MRFEDIGRELGAIVDDKQRKYGDSVGSTRDLIRLLYPSGVPESAYGDVHLLVRIFDKMKRIATDPDAYGEDPYLDIAGYGLLGYRQARKTTVDAVDDAKER